MSYHKLINRYSSNLDDSQKFRIACRIDDFEEVLRLLPKVHELTHAGANGRSFWDELIYNGNGLLLQAVAHHIQPPEGVIESCLTSSNMEIFSIVNESKKHGEDGVTFFQFDPVNISELNDRRNLLKDAIIQINKSFGNEDELDILCDPLFDLIRAGMERLFRNVSSIDVDSSEPLPNKVSEFIREDIDFSLNIRKFVSSEHSVVYYTSEILDPMLIVEKEVMRSISMIVSPEILPHPIESTPNKKVTIH